jgi:archaemetzincin
MRSSKSTARCQHSKLTYALSSHAESVKYKQPSLEQRIAATTPSGTLKPKVEDSNAKRDAKSCGTFPAPLILPNDDLALDPTYPAQSLRGWIREKDRNKVVSEQRTIYLAAPPTLDEDVNFVKGWTSPGGQHSGAKIKQPDPQHVLAYLKAFYHGLPVKMLPKTVFNFTAQVDDLADMANGKKTSPNRKTVGLSTGTESGCKGIRYRPTPDGLFPHQLNLDDLLDAAIWALPADAYALLLLVEHDLYEDEEDEFVCGRAYGGSRVAVISTARYHPVLDSVQGIEREHAWPASHCEEYLQSCLNAASTDNRRKKTKSSTKAKAVIVIDDDSTSDELEDISPMQAAVSAHSALPSLEVSPSTALLSGLWLGRVCRTVSHELGHCFGMDHCVYYACSMQGSASIVEDARQPPYLCPVDSAKLLRATEGDVKERYTAIVKFCGEHKDVHLFAAYGAWIRARLEQM